MPLNENQRTCAGKSRRTGKPCTQPAVEGSSYCRFHGGGGVGNRGRTGMPKPPGSGGPPPKGNQNARKHGAYSARLLPDEQEHFDRIKAAFEEELGGADKLSASDRLLVFRLASNGAKITVATEKGAPPEALIPLQRLELELLRELKTTRASKDGGSSMGTSPAEVMAALIARVRERQALPARVIDAESVEVRNPDEQEG